MSVRPTNKSQAQSPTKIPRFLIPLLLIIFLLTLGIHQVHQGMLPLVVIVGDSNSDPSAILEVQKWTQEYSTTHLDDEHVFNLSVGGHAVQDFNTPDINQQLLDISKQIHPGQKVILISLLGTNNAIMSHKIYTPDDFISHYDGLINQFSKSLHPNAIIIGSVPPAIRREVEGIYPMDPRGPDLIPQLNESLKKWVIAKQTASRQTEWFFVSILPESSYGTSEASSYLIFDGIHLNDVGQSIVYKNVNAVVQQIVK